MAKDIIIVDKKAWWTVASDVTLLLTIAGIISIGVWLSSAAMQWFGFVIGILGIVSIVYRAIEGRIVRTPQSAADYLKRYYGVTATSNNNEERKEAA